MTTTEQVDPYTPNPDALSAVVNMVGRQWEIINPDVPVSESCDVCDECGNLVSPHPGTLEFAGVDETGFPAMWFGHIDCLEAIA